MSEQRVHDEFLIAYESAFILTELANERGPRMEKELLREQLITYADDVDALFAPVLAIYDHLSANINLSDENMQFLFKTPAELRQPPWVMFAEVERQAAQDRSTDAAFFHYLQRAVPGGSFSRTSTIDQFMQASNVSYDTKARLMMLYSQHEHFLEQYQRILQQAGSLLEEKLYLVEPRVREQMQLVREKVDRLGVEGLVRDSRLSLKVRRPSDVTIYPHIATIEQAHQMNDVLLWGIGILDIQRMHEDDIFSQEKTMEVLRVLSDRTKFELLRMLGEDTLYGTELAERLMLSAATISHHISQLSSLGLIHIIKQANRIYYRTNKGLLVQYLDSARNMLVHEPGEGIARKPMVRRLQAQQVVRRSSKIQNKDDLNTMTHERAPMLPVEETAPKVETQDRDVSVGTFEGNLDESSRWVQLANALPWDAIEAAYTKTADVFYEGQLTKSARMAFGALYIQISEGYKDEQTRQQIQESPEMQYFCGYSRFIDEPPFDATLMAQFRRRITPAMLLELMSMMFAEDAIKQMRLSGAPSLVHDEAALVTDEEPNANDDQEISAAPAESDATKNHGILLLDAIFASEDTDDFADIDLLNEVRGVFENAVETLYARIRTAYEEKPRTYRRKANKDYLTFVKKSKQSPKELRAAIRKQLEFIAHNMRTLEDLIENGASLSALSRQNYRKLLISMEVFRQQQQINETKSQQVEGKIVSLAHPHLRPIASDQEQVASGIGAKLAIGFAGGFAFASNMQWENFPESGLLQAAAEEYRSILEDNPAVIVADRVYPNRENRLYCAERGIHLAGPKLGRKSIVNSLESATRRYQEIDSPPTQEGTIGPGRIMAKLTDASQTSIAMGFFVANMEKQLRNHQLPAFEWYVDYDVVNHCLVVLPADRNE